MAALIQIMVDGERHQVREGTPLAAALLRLGVTAFRISVQGEHRAPVCGMGSCFECRVVVDGRPHQRACLIPCAAGMVVHTAQR